MIGQSREISPLIGQNDVRHAKQELFQEVVVCWHSGEIWIEEQKKTDISTALLPHVRQLGEVNAEELRLNNSFFRQKG